MSRTASSRDPAGRRPPCGRGNGCLTGRDIVPREGEAEAVVLAHREIDHPHPAEPPASGRRCPHHAEPVLHPGHVVGLAGKELAQRLTLIRRVVAAPDLQAEGRVLEGREELAERVPRPDELTQRVSPWYLRT